MTLSADLATYVASVAVEDFGSPINTYAPASPDDLDQPWVRTGPLNHVYVDYNNLNNYPAGNTASVNVSTDGGLTYTTTVIDRIGGTVGQDAPAARLDVNGSPSYPLFPRLDPT